jgi:2-(1,2-epoxy-1,2-dihydrophenyl)acetyl-CoA isomerase
LLDATLAWAEELAAKAPLSLRYAKQAVNQAAEASLAQTISDEAALQSICVASEDSQEGGAAFLQKREPVWKGR